MGEMGKAHSIFIAKYEGKSRPGSSRYAGDGNIKIDAKETGSEGVYWIHVVEEQAPVLAVLNTRVSVWEPQRTEISCLLSNC
jgi:hypothetical protein